MYIVSIFIVIPIFIIVSMIHWVRRYFFEFFYFLHIYGSFVLIIGILFHASNGWYFMIPGLFVQFYERIMRMWNSTQIVRLMHLEQLSQELDVTKLEIAIPYNFSFDSGKWSALNNHPNVKLGGYCFLNIPSISPWQWHPFSIANPLNSTSTVFYIKNMHRGFTKTLSLLAANAYPNTISIAIEGPYGVDLDYENYGKIVLVAGGIGITPFHNIFFTLYHEFVTYNHHMRIDSDHSDNSNLVEKKKFPDIDLIWVAQRANAFHLFQPSFRLFKQTPVHGMRIRLFATRERSSIASDLRAHVCFFF